MTKTDRNLISTKLECVYSSLNDLYDVLQNQSASKYMDIKSVIEDLKDLNPDDELIKDLTYLSNNLTYYSKDFKMRK